jgi:membrane associated rhomboid family serine protease
MSAAASNAAGQRPQENPILAAYSGWASSRPLVTRSVCILLVVLFIVGVFIDLESALNNNLRYTIFNFEIYRLITASIWCTGALNLVFALLAFNQMGSKLEINGGSARLLALIGTLDLCGNLAFLALNLIFTVIGDQRAEFKSSQGFWNILMPLIAIECMQMPDEPRKIFFFPCDIPSKYYPMALFGLFSLFAGVRIDMGLALLTGYAFALGKLDFLKPSNARVQGWDEGVFRNFSTREGYILAGSSQEPWIPLNNPSNRPNSVSTSRDISNVSTISTIASRSQPVSGSNESKPSSKSTSGAFAGAGQTLGGGSKTTTLRGNTDTAASARALRLAALEARSNSTNINANIESNSNVVRESGTNVTSSLLTNTDHEVMMLQDMGYSIEESQEALHYSNGDISAAVTYLSESRNS